MEDRDDESRVAPVPVASLGLAVQIAAGDEHTCARAISGPAFCWGRGSEGQLGDGTTTPAQTSPTLATGL